MKVLIIFLVIYLNGIACQATLKRVILKDTLAVCLDGTPGVYYIDKGEDPKTIVLYFEGGAWCGDKDLSATLESCYQRSKTKLGSSKYWDDNYIGPGLLSTNP